MPWWCGVLLRAPYILTQIAAAIATVEETSTAQVKAEILQKISVSLARSAAKAVTRRRPRVYTEGHACTRRAIAEVRLLQPPGDEEA